MPAAANAETMMADFHEEIRRQEDLLYGVALFYEVITHLYAGQKAELETYRKQFRNIIQIGNTAIERAVGMLERARQNPERVDMFRHFTFVPCLGHSNPDELAKRAMILVQTYNEIFPGRPRGQSFETAEIMRLMEAASVKMP